MQRRHEPHDSLDDFPTQPWATRALMEHVLFPRCGEFAPREYFKKLRVWEPACNRGHMAEPLKEYFGRVFTSDIHDYGDEYAGQERVVDFLWSDSESPAIKNMDLDWIITNPPFRLAEQFLQRAYDVGAKNYAMIFRTSYIEGVERYENIFSKSPPSYVAQFVERVPMVKGRLTRKGSTATSYCWLVWQEGVVSDDGSSKLVWIPPCRKKLERAEDYP